MRAVNPALDLNRACAGVEGSTILLATGDRDRHRLLNSLLAQCYRVLRAGNPSETVEIARNESPELILLDVTMVSCEESGLVNALGADSGTRHIPLIAFALRGDDPSQEQVMKAPTDDTLSQPFSERELFVLVGLRLAASRLHAERARAELRERQLVKEVSTATAKLKAIFDQSAIFAGIMSLDGVVREANRACVEVCGYHREQVIGIPFWETPWWRASREVQDKLRAGTALAAKGQTYAEVLPYVWADGSEHVVEFALYPIPDDVGRVIFLYPTGVDITERKHTEKALGESETRLTEIGGVAGLSSDFRALFEAAPTPFIVLAPSDFRIIAVNDSYLQATMTRRENLLGRGLFDVFPDNPDNPRASGVESFRTSLERVAATGQADMMLVQRYDIQRPPELGGGFEERYWSPFNAPLLGVDGRVVCIIQRTEDVTEIMRLRTESAVQGQIARDQLRTLERLRHTNAELVREIVERQRAEGQLRESEERFRLLFNSIDECFCVIELIFDSDNKAIDYRFIQVNPSFEKETGLKSPQGRTIRELAPDYEDRWLERYGNIALTGEPARFEHYAEQASIWFDVYAFRFGKPEKRQVAVLFNNVTQHKQAAATLLKTEKLAAVGRLAATIAHEINNPLEAVTNLIWLLQNDPTLPPHARKHLRAADEELFRVAHLTKQTLSFYRGGPDVQRLRLGELIDGVLAIFGPRFRNKSVTLRKEVDSESAVIGVNGELRQIIANLVSNSVDAVHNGGNILIRAYPAKKGEISGTRMTIADDGTGITRSDRKRIFEPFFSTKRDVGTGLGLWVTKNIVQKHQGSIQVRSSSQPGHSWTVFSIFLPDTLALPEKSGASPPEEQLKNAS